MKTTLQNQLSLQILNGAVSKTPLATINFYYSTQTLQVQGKACSEMGNLQTYEQTLYKGDNTMAPPASPNDQNSADEISIFTSDMPKIER